MSNRTIAERRGIRPALDDPLRFASSERLGPWVGLTPSRNRSGERDVSGGITKAGDVTPSRRLRHDAPRAFGTVETSAAQVERRRGEMRAMVRGIGLILHRIWGDDTGFRFDVTAADAAR